MGIQRKKVPEPKWYEDDYAEISTYDLFSEERWGQTVEWDVILEQAKKIDTIVLLIDKHVHHSQLFLTYLDILEANFYIFDDIIYYLIGKRIGNSSNPSDFYKNRVIYDFYSRIRFWNMDCRNVLIQIYNELLQIEEHLMSCLNQSGIESIKHHIKEECLYCGDLDMSGNKKLEIAFPSVKAQKYAISAYKEKILLKPIVSQFLNILNFLGSALMVFSQVDDMPKHEDFPTLLEMFRESERGKNEIRAWERDLDGTRDSLISKIEKDRKLGAWVLRYIHLREDENIIRQLFYDEKTNEIINEKECFNTDNWISLLTIAAILQEYDERQNKPAIQTTKSSRKIKRFHEFVKDAERTEEILGKLHRLIGNKTNADALKIIAKAMWIDWLDKPTATSIRNEFNTITCKDQQVSKSLKEPKPTRQSMIDKIKQEFEQA